MPQDFVQALHRNIKVAMKGNPKGYFKVLEHVNRATWDTVCIQYMRVSSGELGLAADLVENYLALIEQYYQHGIRPLLSEKEKNRSALSKYRNECKTFKRQTEDIPSELIAWLNQSASQKNPKAQFMLGRCYESGLLGVKESLDEAMKYYADSEKQGYEEAMIRLAYLHKKKNNYQLASLAAERAIESKNLNKKLLVLAYEIMIELHSIHQSSGNFFRDYTKFAYYCALLACLDKDREYTLVYPEYMRAHNQVRTLYKYRFDLNVLNKDHLSNEGLLSLAKYLLESLCRDEIGENRLRAIWAEINACSIEDRALESFKDYDNSYSYHVSSMGAHVSVKKACPIANHFDELKPILILKYLAKDNADAQYLFSCFYLLLKPAPEVAELKDLFGYPEMIPNYHALSEAEKSKSISRLREQGMEYLHQSAKSGHLLSQLQLGFYYQHGVFYQLDRKPEPKGDVDRSVINLDKAVFWFEKSIATYSVIPKAEAKSQETSLVARSGSDDYWEYKEIARIEVANIYQNNPSVRFNYLKSNIQGATSAMPAELGHLYIEQKNPDALGLLQKASEDKTFMENNITVDYDLGVCYESGLGVKSNIDIAIEKYEHAKKNGNEAASKELFRITRDTGVACFKSNDPRAFAYLKKAIDQVGPLKEDASVEYHQGLCYLNGLGCKKDLEEAERFFTQASKKGNISAKNAQMRSDFRIPLLENRIAANKNKAESQAELGHILLDQSDNKAVPLLIEALQSMQSPQAHYDMAVCYERGFGVSQDSFMAAELYQKAAESDNQELSKAAKAAATKLYKNDIIPRLASNTIQVLSLKNTYLNDADLDQLEVVLSQNATVIQLNLTSASFSARAEIFAGNLKRKVCLEILTPSNKWRLVLADETLLSPLDAFKEYQKFAHKHDNARVAATRVLKASVVPMLISDNTVTSLNLQYTNIEDTDLLMLQDMLQKNVTLQELDLRNTQVNEQFIEKFSTSIKRPTGLKIFRNDNKASNVYGDSTIQIQNRKQSSAQRDDKLDITLDLKIDYGKITLVKKIGSGGFSVVHRAIHKHENVAVKLMKDSVNPTVFKAFEEEVQTMARLQSRYLVRIFGYCLNPHALVTEYMEQGSLYDVLRGDNKLEIQKRYKQVALSIAYGIAHLHDNNIIHRDIKSLNILINEHYEAKVADFGLSVNKGQEENASIVSNRTAGGSLRWMAPEQITQEDEKDHATKQSDVYSYGRTLFELVTGKVPFEKVKNQALIPGLVASGQEEPLPDDCPPLLKNVIHLCLFSNPKERPDIDKVIKILEADVVAQPVSSAQNDNADSALASGYLSNLATMRRN